jgi:cold shock CspA family protein
LRPVSNDLRRDHSRHVENFPLLATTKTGHVKWPATRKNYTYLTMADGRDVFLHRDDFNGPWPPRYWSEVEFELLETGHKTCPFRAKDAKPAGVK